MSAVQIPQSTSRIIRLKLFLTGTTTPATGKTVAVTLAKTSGDYANPSAGATNATEISNGWYYFTASTTDTGTLGDLVVKGSASGCDDSERLFAVVKATNAGLTGVPDAAANAAGGLPISIVGGLDLDEMNVDIEAIQTGVAAIPTNPYTGTPPTVAQIATAVWQDATAGDFTTASSIGKSLYSGGNAPGAAGGMSLVGSAMTLADGSITDAKFTLPTLTAPATGAVGMLEQLWRRFFKQTTKTTTQIKTFANDGTTVVTTQTISDDLAGNQSQGAAT